MVQAFQTIISRNKKPVDAGVISVTMIHTGEATNVVPDSCELQGTVRTFTLEVLDMIEQRMRRWPSTPAPRTTPLRIRVCAQLPAHHQQCRPRPTLRAR
jgi:acetylornithine deacetylase/succinyl-diaminopimelate desuccinylase-like protein